MRQNVDAAKQRTTVRCPVHIAGMTYVFLSTGSDSNKPTSGPKQANGATHLFHIVLV